MKKLKEEERKRDLLQLRCPTWREHCGKGKGGEGGKKRDIRLIYRDANCAYSLIATAYVCTCMCFLCDECIKIILYT